MADYYQIWKTQLALVKHIICFYKRLMLREWWTNTCSDLEKYYLEPDKLKSILSAMNWSQNNKQEMSTNGESLTTSSYFRTMSGCSEEVTGMIISATK